MSCGLRTVDCGLQPADCRLRTADCGLRTADCGLRTADCGLRTADCGLRTADCGLRTADCGLRTADCGLRGHSFYLPDCGLGIKHGLGDKMQGQASGFPHLCSHIVQLLQYAEANGLKNENLHTRNRCQWLV